jgi:putative oxidoreductase
MNGIELNGTLDVVLLGFRATLAIVIFMHGYNHLFGPGGVDGTARWFGGLGFRPPRVHALMSGYLELALGVGLAVGLFNALACAGLVGIMAVAGLTHHRSNGFFIFREGYEYVLVVAVAAVALAAVGPGSWSLDSVLGLVDYSDTQSPGLAGGLGALIAAGGGSLGAAALLVFGWRPVAKQDVAA